MLFLPCIKKCQSAKKAKFESLLANMSNNKKAVICGLMNCPESKWKKISSPLEYKNSIIDLFEDNIYRQAIEFPTWSNITLNIVFFIEIVNLLQKQIEILQTFSIIPITKLYICLLNAQEEKPDRLLKISKASEELILREWTIICWNLVRSHHFSQSKKLWLPKCIISKKLVQKKNSTLTRFTVQDN